MTDTSIYKDIAERTGGDVYIGVVGPVRSGKSTFIKKKQVVKIPVGLLLTFLSMSTVSRPRDLSLFLHFFFSFSQG